MKCKLFCWFFVVKIWNSKKGEVSERCRQLYKFIQMITWKWPSSVNQITMLYFIFIWKMISSSHYCLKAIYVSIFHFFSISFRTHNSATANDSQDLHRPRICAIEKLCCWLVAAAPIFYAFSHPSNAHKSLAIHPHRSMQFDKWSKSPKMRSLCENKFKVINDVNFVNLIECDNFTA